MYMNLKATAIETTHVVKSNNKQILTQNLVVLVSQGRLCPVRTLLQLLIMKVKLKFTYICS